MIILADGPVLKTFMTYLFHLLAIISFSKLKKITLKIHLSVEPG